MTMLDDVEVKAYPRGDHAPLTLAFEGAYETTETGPNGQERPIGIAEHIVAVTGVVDHVGDVFVPGAFARAIARNDIRPRGVSSHNWAAKTSKALERAEWMPGSREIKERVIPALAPGVVWPAEAGAVYVKAKYNLMTAAGRDAFNNAKFYGPDEAYSVGWRVRGDGARKRAGIRYITDLDWFEWSDVLHGAHPLAFGMSTKSWPDAGTLERTLPVAWGDTIEVKARYVRDPEFWGLPYGTPIRTGMRPRSPKARKMREAGHRVPATAGTTADPAADRERPVTDEELAGRPAAAAEPDSSAGTPGPAERARDRSLRRRAAVRSGDTAALAALAAESAVERQGARRRALLASPLTYRLPTPEDASALARGAYNDAGPEPMGTDLTSKTWDQLRIEAERQRRAGDDDRADELMAERDRRQAQHTAEMADAVGSLPVDEQASYLDRLDTDDPDVARALRAQGLGPPAAAEPDEAAGAADESDDEVAEAGRILDRISDEAAWVADNSPVLAAAVAAASPAVRAEMLRQIPDRDLKILDTPATGFRAAVAGVQSTRLGTLGQYARLGAAADMSALAKRNQTAQNETFDQLSDEELGELARQASTKATVLRRRARVGERPEADRMQRLWERVIQAQTRRARSARGTAPREMTDRNVLDALGGENLATDELAAMFGVDQPRMLATLRRLEKDGYISRNAGGDSGESISGGRRKVTALGWESAAGRDGDHADVLRAYDAEHSDASAEPSADADGVVPPIASLDDAVDYIAGTDPVLRDLVRTAVNPATPRPNRASAWGWLADRSGTDGARALDQATVVATLPRTGRGKSVQLDMTGARAELQRLADGDPTHPIVAMRDRALVTARGADGSGAVDAPYTGQISSVSTNGTSGRMQVTVSYAGQRGKVHQGQVESGATAALVLPSGSPAVGPPEPARQREPAQAPAADGDPPTPEGMTAQRRAQIVRALEDYAARYGGPNSATPGVDDGARYTIEGHVKDATRDEWRWATDYLRAHPELLTRTPATDSQIRERDAADAEDRKNRGSALANEAQTAFSAGDAERALELIDQAAALLPEYEANWKKIRAVIDGGRDRSPSDTDREPAGDETPTAAEPPPDMAEVAPQLDPAESGDDVPAATPALTISAVEPVGRNTVATLSDGRHIGARAAGDPIQGVAVEVAAVDVANGRWGEVIYTYRGTSHRRALAAALIQLNRDTARRPGPAEDRNDDAEPPAAGTGGTTAPDTGDTGDTAPGAPVTMPDGRALEPSPPDETEADFLVGRWVLRSDAGRLVGGVEEGTDGQWSWTAYIEPYAGGNAANQSEAVRQLADALGLPAASQDTATLDADEIADAVALRGDALGLSEAEDGELEVTPAVAERQDRVERMLTADSAGRLDLNHRSDAELGATRVDVVSELRLQEEIARRDRERRLARDRPAGVTDEDGGGADPTPAGSTGPTPAADTTARPEPGPKWRPGVAGAAEDLADAIESGDTSRTVAALTRARSSVRRSRSESPHLAELRAMLDAADGTDGTDPDPTRLRQRAVLLREEARDRRNTAARGRRRARRLERERLRSLLGRIDTELRGRDLDPYVYGGPAPGERDDLITAAELTEAATLAAPEPPPATPGAPTPDAAGRKPGETGDEDTPAGTEPDDTAAEPATAPPAPAPVAPGVPVDGEPMDAGSPQARILASEVGASYEVDTLDGTGTRRLRVSGPPTRFADTNPDGVGSVEVVDASGTPAYVRASTVDGRPVLTIEHESTGRTVQLDPQSWRPAATPVVDDGRNAGERLGEYRATSTGAATVRGRHYQAAYELQPDGTYSAEYRLVGPDGTGIHGIGSSMKLATREDALRDIREQVIEMYEGSDAYGRRVPDDEVLPAAPEVSAAGAGVTRAPGTSPARRAAVSPNAMLNPMTGRRDWSRGPELAPDALPTRFAEADLDEVRAHMQKVMRRRDDGVTSLDEAQWDTAMLSPGGGLLVYKGSYGAGYKIRHTVSGMEIGTGSAALGRADAMRFATALSRGIGVNGQRINWDLPAGPELARSVDQVTGGEGSSDLRLTLFGLSGLISDKVNAGQASSPIVSAARWVVGTLRTPDPRYDAAMRRALDLTGAIGLLLAGGRRRRDDRRDAATIADDAKTVAAVKASVNLEGIGSPDRAIAILERRADELDALYGRKEAGGRGAIMLRRLADTLRDGYRKEPAGRDLLATLKVGDQILVADQSARRGHRVLRVVEGYRGGRVSGRIGDDVVSVRVSEPDSERPDHTFAVAASPVSLSVPDWGDMGNLRTTVGSGTERPADSFSVLADGEQPPAGYEPTRLRIQERGHDPVLEDAITAARATLDSQAGEVSEARAPRSTRTGRKTRAAVAARPASASRSDIDPEVAARIIDRQTAITRGVVGDVQLADGPPRSSVATVDEVRELWRTSSTAQGYPDPRRRMAEEPGRWATARLSAGGWFVTFGDGQVVHVGTGLSPLATRDRPATQAAADRVASYAERVIDPTTGQPYDWSDLPSIQQKNAAPTPLAKSSRVTLNKAAKLATLDEVLASGPRASKAALASLPELPGSVLTEYRIRPVSWVPYADATGAGQDVDWPGGSFPSAADEAAARRLRSVMRWAAAVGPIRPYDTIVTLRGLAEQAGDSTISRNVYGKKQRLYEPAPLLGTSSMPVAEVLRGVADQLQHANDPAVRDEAQHLEAQGEGPVRVRRARVAAAPRAVIHGSAVSAADAADYAELVEAAVMVNGAQMRRSAARPGVLPQWEMVLRIDDDETLTIGGPLGGDTGRVNINGDGSVTATWRGQPQADGSGGVDYQMTWRPADWVVDDGQAELVDLDGFEAGGSPATLAGPAAADDPRWAEADRLVEEEGLDELAAYAEAFGKDVAQVRRDDAMARLRSDGFEGRGFEELARAAYRQALDRDYFLAEAGTNGVLLGRAGEDAGLDPRELWRRNEAYARKHASDELLAWWDEHGRLTFDEFAEGLLHGSGGSGERTTGDSWTR